jgi:Secretion system C-terminal sorting domain
MLIASSNGSNASYPLSEISNVVFTNNTLVVDNGECQKHHYSVFFTDYITLDGTIQVEPVHAMSAMALFPNPAGEHIKLLGTHTEVGDVRVFSATGMLIYYATCKSSTCEIDVSTWAPGMYIILSNGQTLQFAKQ